MSETIKSAAEKYINYGLVAVPENKAMKCPITPTGMNASWKDVGIPEAKTRWTNDLTAQQDAIGILCGLRSGNLEVLDFDFGGIKFQPWYKLIPSDLLAKLVIERSPSGGFHVGYRCEKIEGDIHLAKPPKPETKGEKHGAYIETRGEGGNIMVYPTPGYSLINKSWEQVQKITPEERDTLISAARSLNEYFPTPKAPKPPATRKVSAKTFTDEMKPGERFNAEASYSTTIGLLTSAGWTETGDGHVIRPGKETGKGGSVGERGGFHCFTSSNGDFDGGETYTPFAVYAVLQHGGDFSAAARSLADKYGMDNPAKPATGAWESNADKEIEDDGPDYYAPQEIELPMLPKPISVIANAIAGILQEPVSVQAVTAAIYCMSAAVGKRIIIPNRGQMYYPNLWIALLRATGENKSSFANLVGDIIKDSGIVMDTPNGLTMASFIATYGSKILPAKQRGQTEQDGSEMLKRRTDIAQRHALNRNGTVLVVDEMRTFFMTLLGLTPIEKVKNAQLLCSLTENRTVTDRTETNGWRVIGDPAISFLGLSQTDPYNAEMRSADLQTGGLAGRIVPVNGQQLRLKGWRSAPASKADAVKVLSIAWSFAQGLERISPTITFGEGEDALGTAYERLATHPVIQWFKVKSPEEYANMRSKIIVQAAKVAVLIAVAAEVERQGQKKDQFGWEAPGGDVPNQIDAAQWIDTAMQIVGLSHITNAQHEESMTPEQQQIDRLLETIKRARRDPKNATNRSLYRKMKMKAVEMNQLLKMLISDGAIVERLHPDGFRFWAAERGKVRDYTVANGGDSVPVSTKNGDSVCPKSRNSGDTGTPVGTTFDSYNPC